MLEIFSIRFNSVFNPNSLRLSEKKKTEISKNIFSKKKIEQFENINFTWLRRNISNLNFEKEIYRNCIEYVETVYWMYLYRNTVMLSLAFSVRQFRCVRARCLHEKWWKCHCNSNWNCVKMPVAFQFELTFAFRTVLQYTQYKYNAHKIRI